MSMKKPAAGLLYSPGEQVLLHQIHPPHLCGKYLLSTRPTATCLCTSLTQVHRARTNPCHTLPLDLMAASTAAVTVHMSGRDNVAQRLKGVLYGLNPEAHQQVGDAHRAAAHAAVDFNEPRAPAGVFQLHVEHPLQQETARVGILGGSRMSADHPGPVAAGAPNAERLGRWVRALLKVQAAWTGAEGAAEHQRLWAKMQAQPLRSQGGRPDPCQNHDSCKIRHRKRSVAVAAAPGTGPAPAPTARPAP
jgi:hypothetical protein